MDRVRRGVIAFLAVSLGMWLALARKRMSAESNNTAINPLKAHSCEALVLACIDFRFHEAMVAELHRMGIKSFDLKSDAGACKHLVSGEKPAVADWMLENIGISQRLHEITRVVIINHYDCGAYGGNKAFESEDAQIEFHRGQLAQSKAKVRLAFPGLDVVTLFAKPGAGGLQLLPL